MNSFKRKNGISLVALVITIIVLIILTAAVVITGINTPENTEYAVKMHNKATLQDAVTLYVMTEMLNNIDNFVVTSTGATKARDVADIVKDLYEDGTWKTGAEVKLGISMTNEELNTVFELDDKAVVTFAAGQEPTLDGTEGGNNNNQSSSNPNQSSSNPNQSSSNPNQSSSNPNQSSGNDNQGTTPTGNLLVPGVLEALPASSIASSTAWVPSSAPFAYNDVTYFAGKTITKIGFPVKTVSAIDANQTITVAVIKNDFKTTVTTHTLKAPVDQLGTSTTVNKWIYFDCNITVGADETLAFFKSGDTVIPGYLTNGGNSQYKFKVRAGATNVGEAGAANNIYVAIYAE